MRAAGLPATLLAMLLAALLLAGQRSSQAAPLDYTAETTYAKLAPRYPFIRIASRAVPPDVRAVKDLTYAIRGRALQLDLYLPAAAATAAPAPRPAIVFVHGGGWNAGVRDNFAPMAIRMAQHGYAAATVSYRLASEARYPAAVDDVRDAVRWVRAHARQYGIDPGRIALAGGSAGGQIASLAGVTGDRIAGGVQAIVNIDGLSDFTSEEARRYEDDPHKPSSAGAWFGGRYAEQPGLWREASPLFHAGGDTPPMLFIGSGQPRFSVGRAQMVEKLAAAGVPHRVVVLPDTPHGFWLFDPWLAPTVEATAAFLDASLRAHRVSWRLR